MASHCGWCLVTLSSTDDKETPAASKPCAGLLFCLNHHLGHRAGQTWLPLIAPSSTHSYLRLVGPGGTGYVYMTTFSQVRLPSLVGTWTLMKDSPSLPPVQILQKLRMVKNDGGYQREAVRPFLSVLL